MVISYSLKGVKKKFVPHSFSWLVGPMFVFFLEERKQKDFVNSQMGTKEFKRSIWGWTARQTDQRIVT